MEPVDVVVRPEDIKMVPEDQGMLKGVVTSVIFKGVHYEMEVLGAGFTWKIHNTTMAAVDSRVGLNIFPNDIHIMKKAGGI